MAGNGYVRGVAQGMLNSGGFYASSTLLGCPKSAGVGHRGNWVGVENQLPEEDVRVLVYIDSERSYTKIDTDRMLNGKWVRWGTDVSHWMPLPEPPMPKE